MPVRRLFEAVRLGGHSPGATCLRRAPGPAEDLEAPFCRPSKRPRAELGAWRPRQSARSRRPPVGPRRQTRRLAPSFWTGTSSPTVPPTSPRSWSPTGFAKRKAECVQQDRLAGAGLARQYRHALGELQCELVDDRKLANVQGLEHQRLVSVGRRSERPQFSLERSSS